MVLPLASRIANVQLVGLDKGGTRKAVPVGHCFIVFSRLVLSTVFEADQGVLAERHEIGQEKAISRLDHVFFVLRRAWAGGARGVSYEGEGHVAFAPVIAAAAPFLRASALGLRGQAVVEEKSRVSFERGEFCAMGENPGIPYEMP